MDSKGRDRVVLAVVLVAVSVLVGLHVRDNPALSHIDELQHMDYVLKSPFYVVNHGETIGQEAMDEAACRGIDYPLRLGIDGLYDWLRLTGERGVAELRPDIVTRAELPPCRSLLLEPAQFPNSGINTASSHPPVYYTTTALAAEAADVVPGVDSPVTAARLVGILWLGAAIAVLWYALGALGASSGVKAALVGLLAVSPIVIHEASIINPDTTALLGGALVLAAVLRWEAGRAPGWFVLVATLVAIWLKLTNATAVGAAVVYLAVRAWQNRSDQQDRSNQEASPRDPDRVRRTAVLVGAMVAVTLVSALFWSVLQDQRGLIPAEQIPTNAIFAVDSFQWESLGNELFSTLSPLRDQFVPDSLPRQWLEPLADLTNLLVLVGLAAVAYFTTRGSQYRALAGAAAVTMVITGVVTMVGNYLALGIYFDTNPRYGLALLPFAAAAAVPVVTQRHIRWITAGVAVVTAGATFVGVVT